MRSFKMAEVTKYRINHPFMGNLATCFLMNLDTWNRLPKDLQELVTEAALEVEDELIAVTVAGSTLYFVRDIQDSQRTNVQAKLDKALDDMTVISASDIRRCAEAQGDVIFLEYINGLNGKELKNLYLSRLRERNDPGNGGAGIGLIDIARRVISPINYTIHEIDNKKSFFSVNVII